MKGDDVCFSGGEYQKDHSWEEITDLLASIGQPAIILVRLIVLSISIQCFDNNVQRDIINKRTVSYLLVIFFSFCMIILLNNCIHYVFGCYVHPIALINNFILS